MKENRKIEELILTFVSTATASLKKNPQLSGDAWKSELNKQIPMFIRMLRECFSNVSSVPPELLSRLDTYSIKLDASPPTDTGSDSGYSASMSPDPPVPGSSGTLSQHVSDMPLVQTVAKLFGYTTSQVQNDLSSIKQICTERVRNHCNHHVIIVSHMSVVGSCRGPEGLCPPDRSSFTR